MWGETVKRIAPLVHQTSSKIFTGPHVNRGNILITILPLSRNLSSQRLTNSIELITNTPKPLALVSTNKSNDTKFTVERLNSSSSIRGQEEPPLVVILSWLMARRKHIMNYAQFYLDQGFHVLSVTCNPVQLLFPTLENGAKNVGKDVLTFINSNPQYNRTLIHGFSVGAFIWSNTMIEMNQNPEKYQPLMDRVIMGQIWDSVVDIEGISQGIGTALFPKSRLLQKSIQAYVRFHVNTFQESATQHYLHSSMLYHNTIVRSPALFLSSKDDPVAFYYIVERVMDKWEKRGVEVFMKTWEHSPHVSHMWKHPQDYKGEMKAFLEKLGLLRYPERFQVQKPALAVAAVN